MKLKQGLVTLGMLSLLVAFSIGSCIALTVEHRNLGFKCVAIDVPEVELSGMGALWYALQQLLSAFVDAWTFLALHY